MSKLADFTITLRALPDRTDPAGTRRLRRGLKYLLRVCGDACDQAGEADGETERKDPLRVRVVRWKAPGRVRTRRTPEAILGALRAVSNAPPRGGEKRWSSDKVSGHLGPEAREKHRFARECCQIRCQGPVNMGEG